MTYSALQTAISTAYQLHAGETIPASAFVPSTAADVTVELFALAFNFYDGAWIWDAVIETLANQGIRAEQKNGHAIEVFQD
jgi:hypothetical protein